MPSTHSSTLLSSNELAKLRDAAALGFEDAAKGLSEMVDKQIKVVSPSLRLIPIAEAPELVGQPDEEVVNVYLNVSGDVEGHVLLVLSLEAANDLLRMLMGPGQQRTAMLDEVERSALGEVGNITSSFFLSALGNSTDLFLQPSPPAVMIDIAGAVLDVPLMSVAVSMEEILIIDTWFIDDEHQIKGLFLMFPSLDSLKLILNRLDRSHG